MKKVIYFALVALILTACSNEEDLGKSSSSKKEIGFKATVGSNTRASQGFCSRNQPGELYVWACVPDGSGYKPYFERNIYTYGMDDDFYTSSSKRYWPDSDIRFYAFPFGGCGIHYTPKWTSDGTTMEFDYTNPIKPEEQFDLMYAASGDVQADEYDGSFYTDLYFRHALSQIEFKAKTEDDDYYVEVVGVKITNIKGAGHYVLPTVTDNYYTGHAGFTGNDYRTTRGTWSNLSGNVYCEATFDPVTFTKADGSVSLTEADTEEYGGKTDGGTISTGLKEYNINTMYLIPQDARSAGKIVLKLKVWKMSDPSKGHQASDKLIFPKSGTDYAEKEFNIPTIWMEGKHYIYTINLIGDELTFTLNVDDYDIGSNEVLTY